MDLIAADQEQAKMATETQPKRDKQAEKHASAPQRVDKFAEARKAKKKAKRIRHRAVLKRSHTKG